MHLPAFLYGTFREVKPRCRRMVTRLRRGVPWDELPAELVEPGQDPFLDTREVPGLLVVDGPSPLAGGGGEHFQLFAPAQVIHLEIPRRLPHTTLDTLFGPMLGTNWGFLALLSQWGQWFLWGPGHQPLYLHALVRRWDELVAEGARYSKGQGYGEPLWEMPTNIHYCLAREGLPQELLKEPVPPGGMAELVAKTRAGLPRA
jgi:hypothetical protein